MGRRTRHSHRLRLVAFSVSAIHAISAGQRGFAVDKKQCSISGYATKLVSFRARQMIGQAGYRECDLEDIEQELRLYLLEHLPLHDPARASEKTFACRLLDGKIAKMIRKRCQKARDSRREDCSLNDPIPDDMGTHTQRANTITEDDADLRWGKRNRIRAEEENLKLDLSLAIAALPETLQRIAELLKTKQPAEVARILGIPPTSLRRDIERIKRAFRKRDLEDYI